MSRKFLTGIDLSQNQLLNAAIQNLSSAPATPVAGQIYYNSSTGNLQYWNGTGTPAWATVNTGTFTNPTLSGTVTLSGFSTAGVVTNYANGVLATSTSLSGLSTVSANTFTSNVVTGTAPLTVASTTVVTNLNANYLNGAQATTANGASTIVARDVSGNFAANTITASLSGTATYATTANAVAVGNISGLGTGVATALAVNTGSAGAFVVNGGALGTPTSGTLTNATGYKVDNLANTGTNVITFLQTPTATVFANTITGWGTGVHAALAVNTGTAGAFVVNGGALGTPASGTLTNATGYKVDNLANTGIGVITALQTAVGASGGLVVVGGALGTPSSGNLVSTSGYKVDNLANTGTNVITFLQTPTSANLANAITDETGTSTLVFSASPTFTGTISANTATFSNNITVPVLPINPTDAASKSYVDNVATGVNAHDSVRVVIPTGTVLAGAYTAGTTSTNPPGDGGTGFNAYITYTGTGAQTIDGQTLALNDRVLVTGGVTASTGSTSPTNGIYVVQSDGIGGQSTITGFSNGSATKVVLVRALDYDNTTVGDISAGDLVFVTAGTAYTNTQWVQTNKGSLTVAGKTSVVIGTDAITFTQFAGQLSTIAGLGLIQNVTSPAQLDVNVDNTTLAIVSDVVGIKSNYAGQSSIVTVGTLTTGSLGTGFTAVNVAQGGIGTNTLTANAVLIGNATGAVIQTTGTADQVLRVPSAGGQPTFGAIDVSKVAAVTGALASSNGGTGTAGTITGLGYFNGASAMTAATAAQVVTVLGSTPVANATTATNAISVGITLDTGTSSPVYPMWSGIGTTGNTGAKVTTALAFVPSTGVLSATGFSGSGAALTSINASNVATGSGSVTIQSASATSLTLQSGASTGSLSIINAGTGGMSIRTTSSTGSITIGGTSINISTYPATNYYRGNDNSSTAATGSPKGGDLYVSGGYATGATGLAAGGDLYLDGGSITGSTTGGIGKLYVGAQTPNITIGYNGSTATIFGTVKTPNLTSNTTASLVRVNASTGQLYYDSTTVATQKYSVAIGAIAPSTGVITWTVTHNLNTSNVIAQIYSSAGAQVEMDITIANANAITIQYNASATSTAGDYTAVVIG